MSDEFESGEVITSYKLNKKTIYHGSEEPSEKIVGMLWLKDDGTLVRWTGSEWHTVAIPTGHVKLPAPSTSDYITPSGASASSHSGLKDSLESGWEYYEVDSYGSLCDGGNDASVKTEGDASRKLDGSGQNWGGGNYMEIRKDLDLTGADTLKFDVRVTDVNLTGYVYVKVLVDEDELFSKDTDAFNPDTWETETVDVSAYTGVHTLRFRVVNTSPYDITWSGVTVWFDNLRSEEPYHPPTDAIDDDTSTYWQPYPANEAGAWIEVDIGQLEIVGAIRVYFPDESYIPSFKISVSEDGSSWEDVLTGQGGEVGWNEYGFNARYVRYIRLTVEDYGSASGIKVGEVDYYSQIVGRVAALHGHGSGVIRWRKGHGVRAGFTLEARMKALEKELDALHSGLMVRRDVGELWNYLKLSREYEKLLLKYIGFLKRLGY